MSQEQFDSVSLLPFKCIRIAKNVSQTISYTLSSFPFVFFQSGNTLSSSISSQTVGATTTRLSKLNLETLDKKRSPVSCDVISGSLVSSCSSSSGVEDAYSQSTNDSGTGTGSPSTATTCTAEESVAIVQSSPNEMKHSQQSSQMVTSHLYSL